MKTLLIYPNIPSQFSLPHSIGHISALLKEKGDDMRLFDSTLYEVGGVTDDEKRVERGQIKPFEKKYIKNTDLLEDFNNFVKDFNPDRIMITFVDSTVNNGYKLLKSLDKHIYTIAGGVSVILNTARFKKPLIDVAWDRSAFEYIFPNDPVKDVYDDWTEFEENRLYRPIDGKYYKTIPLLTTYGCPYNCGFCCAPSLRKKLGTRDKNINFVIDELEYQVLMHNPDFFYISSETFLSSPMSDLKKFATAYSKYNLPFWCQTHINTLTEEKIKLLKDMNCHRVAIGIESGNADYRKNMLKKYFTNDRAIQVFELLNKYDIKAASNNIIVYPLEKEAYMYDTIELNKKLYDILGKNLQINCYIYQPFYGTSLREVCVEHDLMISDEPDTVIGDPVISNPFVSNEKIIELRNKFFELVTGGDTT